MNSFVRSAIRALLLAGFGLINLIPCGLAAAPTDSPLMPMPINESETANYRWLHKPVLASRLLDDMEQTNSWSHHGQGEMSLTTDRARDGTQSLRLRAPTTLGTKTTGRPGGEAVVRRGFGGEDWSGSNRLSFWVYPHLPGFRVISMLVKLHNAGITKVPDGYNREGLNYFLLKPDQWNQVVWEIPHLARDKVTGLDFIYRLQGNEPGATNVVCYDLDHLELQRVKADHFEGWNVAPGKISYSHSGYRLGSRKTAIASGLKARNFALVSQQTGRKALTKSIRTEQSTLDEFQVLDFSEVETPGIFKLQAGGAETPWFPIGENVWRDSVWKTINFFYCERCGMAVPGIHDVCHADWQAVHGDRKMIINGGWHDAGDLSQGLVNTSEAARAMLELAERLERSDPVLARRLQEEARWGLNWIEKTRFGDGFRVTWGTMDYWTDGVIGTSDDTFGDARHSSFDNFLAASAEAKAAQVLKADAKRFIELAASDWQFAIDKTQSPGLELASAGALASLEVFKATGEQKYADKAFEFAGVILNSQQREFTDWQVPLAGFFYTNPKRDRMSR